MKQLIALTTCLLLAVCGGGGESATPESQSGLPATETTDTTGQTPQNTTPASATTTGSTGGTVSNLLPDDKTFISTAAMGGLAEVMMGNIAVQNASSPAVKAFAQRMIADHGRANQELQQLAVTKGMALPAELDGDHKKAADHLNGLSGTEFDKAYMQHMVEDHQKDVAEFQRASASAGDGDLRAWATKTLPVLEQHLQQARSVAGGLR